MASPLPEPGAFAVSNHRAWIGRKEATLRRARLDCDCPNRGEVYFHLWCDRLACRAHAEDEHDCGLFKGKSGIEEGFVEPELPPIDPVIVLPADQFDELMATIDEPDDAPALRQAAERRRLTLADMEEASAAVRARREEQGSRAVELAVQSSWPHMPESVTVTNAVDVSADGSGAVAVRGTDGHVRVFTESEIADWRRHQRLSLECGMHNPLCSGCDGGALDGFSCRHECHTANAGPDAPLVDAALEPDPDALRHSVPAEEIQELWEQLGAEDELPAPAPWWRRMLGGGTR